MAKEYEIKINSQYLGYSWKCIDFNEVLTVPKYDLHITHRQQLVMQETGFLCIGLFYTKVQVGKDQEKAQSEKDSHSKNRGGKKPN